MRAAGVPALLSALVAIAACEGGLLAPDEDRTLGIGADPDLRTSASTYPLASDGFGWTAEIPITYENPTSGTWFLVNCNGGYAFRLEKRVAGAWRPAYSPVLPACLSPPIRIEPGETFAGTIRIFAGFPGNDWHPKFEVRDPEGIYRIVLETRSSFDPDDVAPPPYFGPFLPFAQRVSNVFELRFADAPADGS